MRGMRLIECCCMRSIRTVNNPSLSIERRRGIHARWFVMQKNMSAHRLIYRHNEMFGIWGYNLQQQTGKKKKAANAVARKLSVAMFYMMKTGTEFTYDHYHSIRNIDVFNIPVDLASAYITCSLGSCHGLGKKFFLLLKDFLDHHVTYKQLYDEIKEKLNSKEETDNEPA